MPLPFLIAGAVFLAILLASIASSRGTKKAPAPPAERPEATSWIEEAIARAIAPVASVERDKVLAALRGDPDPDVVTAIEHVVKSATLRFEKLSAGDVEVKIDLTLESGDARQATRRFAYAEIPDEVTSELARTGAAFVVKDFAFPWKSELS